MFGEAVNKMFSRFEPLSVTAEAAPLCRAWRPRCKGWEARVMKIAVWYAHSVDCILHSALENVALLGKLVYQSTFSIYKPV